MEIRGRVGSIFILGALEWPIGWLIVGGDTGSLIAGIGSLLVLGAFAAELLLRLRDRASSGAVDVG